MDVFNTINGYNISRRINCATVGGNHFRTRAICTCKRDLFARHVNYSLGTSNCISSKQFFFLYILLPVCTTMMSNKRCTCGNRDASVTTRHCEIMLYTRILVSSSDKQVCNRGIKQYYYIIVNINDYNLFVYKSYLL